PLSGIIREGRPYVLMLMRRYKEAVADYQELVQFDPSFYKAYTSMGRACLQMGRYRDAIAAIERGRSLGGDLPNIVAASAQAYALAGENSRARELLAGLHDQARTHYVSNSSFAVVHLGLGEKDRALDWLERGVEQR